MNPAMQFSAIRLTQPLKTGALKFAGLNLNGLQETFGQIGNIKVHIAHGDMTQIKTDAYVVPQFNDEGSFNGVAYSIDLKGGLDGLEAYDRIASASTQPFGAVHLTDSGAGKLIHVVSVDSGRDNEFQTIQTAFYNALKLAQAQGFKNITAPALGTGALGDMTGEQSARAMMSAIHKFNQEGGKLDEIALVLYKTPLEYADFIRVLGNKSYENAKPEPGRRGLG